MHTAFRKYFHDSFAENVAFSIFNDKLASIVRFLFGAPLETKKREVLDKAMYSARKAVITVSAQIALYFSETSIPIAILPHSLTTTTRTLNFTFSCHAAFLHMSDTSQIPEAKKGGVAGDVSIIADKRGFTGP